MFEMDVLLGRTFKGKGTANVHKPDPSLLIYSYSSLNSAGFRLSLSLSLSLSLCLSVSVSVSVSLSLLTVLSSTTLIFLCFGHESTGIPLIAVFIKSFSFSFKIKLTGARGFNQLAKSASANTGSTISDKEPLQVSLRFIGALSEYLMGACRIRHGLALML